MLCKYTRNITTFSLTLLVWM